MKKILILAVLTVSIFIISCGGGKSNPTDGDRDETDSVSDASDPSDDSGNSSSDDGDPHGQPDDLENSIPDEDSDPVRINPCDSDPCNPSVVENATGECIETVGTNYYCKCKSGYKWTGSVCQSDFSGSSASLGNICTGQTSCYDDSFVIDIDWPISTYNSAASATLTAHEICHNKHFARVVCHKT